MSDDNFDRILSQREDIVPSSGFAARVMDAVQQEATTPAPIRFPWMRALPGLVACLALAAVLIANFAASVKNSSESAAGLLATDRLFSTLKQMAAGSGTLAWTGWLVVALLLTLATMHLSMRIAGSGK